MDKDTPTAREMTIRHFQDIARTNRFAENASIPHDTDFCLVCRPDRCGEDPFKVYVDVIAKCIPVRRPRLDADLVEAIREDLQWAGQTVSLTVEDLLTRRSSALEAFRLWVRNALETGLELLSVHSPTSLAFSLDDVDGQPEREAFVEACIQHIMDTILSPEHPGDKNQPE